MTDGAGVIKTAWRRLVYQWPIDVKILMEKANNYTKVDEKGRYITKEGNTHFIELCKGETTIPVSKSAVIYDFSSGTPVPVDLSSIEWESDELEEIEENGNFTLQEEIKSEEGKEYDTSGLFIEGLWSRFKTEVNEEDKKARYRLITQDRLTEVDNGNTLYLINTGDCYVPFHFPVGEELEVDTVSEDWKAWVINESKFYAQRYEREEGFWDKWGQTVNSSMYLIGSMLFVVAMIKFAGAFGGEAGAIQGALHQLAEVGENLIEVVEPIVNNLQSGGGGAAANEVVKNITQPPG